MRMVFIQYICFGLAIAAVAADLPRVRKDFDRDWYFALGEHPGAEKINFDHGKWRAVELPHDWAFEADYDQKAAQKDKGGYKPGGIGWYRKTFDLPREWEKRRVEIEFDAVFMNAEVWINGCSVGKRPYGYISFAYDLTEHLKPGGNVVAVRVDSSLEPAARWYHGCGIYGHVHLLATGAVHIVRDGVCIATPKVSKEAATVVVGTEIVSRVGNSGGSLQTILVGPDGRHVAEGSQEFTAAKGKMVQLEQKLKVERPKRWDVDSPRLYSAISRVVVGEKVVDEVSTTFGIRTIRWAPESGFWLNDKNVKLLGVCEHLEGGPVGAAYPDELIRWKIRLLKEMGCNAIRTAHNPQVPRFYDLCDEMGMMVMDEVFDGWRRKAPNDYGKQAFDKWWERDLRDWLRRDRNHPSVIIWSLGNETGGKVAADLVRICHEVDPTRLTTSGHSGTAAMDVEGINGHSEQMSFFTKYAKSKHTKPFVATEAPHTWQTRDFYRTKTWFRDGYPNRRKMPFPCPDLTADEIFTYDWTTPGKKTSKKQVFNSSYDNAMVRITARKNWELMRNLPWYSGHFRWTGFDYLGEAGYVHGGWPFRLFMGGALDVAGFRKDLYYFYQSQWTKEPMVHILPHWTHPRMKPGTKIPVWVYSNCDEVELFLNGRSLGRDKPGRKWDEMQCDWIVPWTVGRIEAVGFCDGREVARAVQQTAGVPAKLAISVEGSDCPIVTVMQVDAKGVRNPYAQNRVHYNVIGPARILSLEGGNPVNTENNCGATSREAFFGKTRAFLKTSAATGDITVVAAAICGDKKLMGSNLVSIDVQIVPIRGHSRAPSTTVRYSTDGSAPITAYEGAFPVEPGAMVKAVVLQGGKPILRMSERFGPKEGLYWGDARVAVTAGAGGDQAEDAKRKNATVSTDGKGFHGKGYVNFGRAQGAYVEWYQENDGGPGVFDLAIRYSCKAKGKKGRCMKLTVNGKVVKPKLLFPNGKDWGKDWKTVRVEVQLQGGANTIRLTTIENGGPYIDDISVQ